MNNYTAFSHIYDEVMDNYDYGDVFRWLKNFLPPAGEGKILEMAMGTGKLTEKLARVHNIVGFDASEDMLAIANRRLGYSSKVSMFQMNMQDFNLYETFDVILCLCDGMNYLPDEQALSDTFQCVKTHLKEGGVFIFDLNTAYRFLEEYGTRTEVREGDDYFMTWENYFEYPVNEYVVNIFLEAENGTYSRYTEIHEEHVFEREIVENILRFSGLKIKGIYDGYTLVPATEKTGRICYVVAHE